MLECRTPRDDLQPRLRVFLSAHERNRLAKQPVSKLPEPSAIKPVRYQEPMTAPTPAAVAGQGN